jgi:hypothetical protein
MHALPRRIINFPGAFTHAETPGLPMRHSEINSNSAVHGKLLAVRRVAALS